MKVMVTMFVCLLMLVALFAMRFLSYKIEENWNIISQRLLDFEPSFRMRVIYLVICFLGGVGSLANDNVRLPIVYCLIGIYAFHFTYPVATECEEKRKELKFLKSQLKNANSLKEYQETEERIRNFEYTSLTHFVSLIAQEMKGWLIAIFVAVTPVLLYSSVSGFYANIMGVLSNMICYVFLLILFPLLCVCSFFILVSDDVYTFSSTSQAQKKHGDKIIRQVVSLQTADNS